MKESLSVTAQLRDQRAVYDELGIDYDWCETQAELDTALEKDWDLHKVRLAALKKEALEKGSQDALDDLHTCNLVDKFEPVVKLSEATDRGLFLKAFNAVTGELQGAAVLASVVVNGLMTACEKEGVEVVPETAVEIVPRRHRSFLKASMEKTEEDSPHGRFASGGTVMTNDNENPGIDFDYIVFCAGPWTNKVLGAAGLDGYVCFLSKSSPSHLLHTPPQSTSVCCEASLARRPLCCDCESLEMMVWRDAQNIRREISAEMRHRSSKMPVIT